MPRTHVQIALLAAALAGAGLTACTGNTKPGEAELPPAAGAGAPARAPLPSLTDDEGTAATARGDTTGTTFPRARAEVAPPISAVIQQVLVEEGDRVKKGQVLFRLRTTDLALHAQQARAAVATAEVGMTSAQVEFDRASRLFEKKVIEQAQFDRAKAQFDAAKAGVDQAKVGVSLARQAMSDADVRSPIDGVVTAKLKNAGEMATMMPPTIVAVVEDHTQLELRFRLPESQVGGLAAGAVVGARFASGAQRDAKVARVAPAVDPATRTVEVVAMIDNADGALRSGMLATVKRPDAPAPTVPEGAAVPAPAHGSGTASAAPAEAADPSPTPAPSAAPTPSAAKAAQP